MTFSERTIERAKQNKRLIVLPEGDDPRVVKAAGMAAREGIADIILLGKEEEVRKLAGDESLEGVKIMDIDSAEKYSYYAEQLFELRKDKGMMRTRALEVVRDPLMFGCMMLRCGDVDGMVAGACHTSSDVLRSALQIVRPRKGVKTVSAFFVVTVPNKEMGHNGTFIFADSGINIDPNAEQLTEIALSSAQTAEFLCEMEPKVAMLSFSTKGSARHADADKMFEATRMAKKQRPDLCIDGELQLDAALVPEVMEIKAPGSEVGGKANVLIFPDLGAGNIGYKLVQRLANAEALGPIVQGLNKPVNDLSRGCSVEDVKKVIAITVVQANQAMNK